MVRDNPYKPHLAEILDIKTENYETKSYTFRFVDSEMQNKFSFEAGQFNMLTVFGVGEAAFSIRSSPSETDRFVHTIKKVGNVTRILDKMQVGEKIGLRGPYGNHWPLDSLAGKNLLLIGGGIGLAPLRPAIYHVLENRNEYRGVEVLCGSRSISDMLFRDELEKWESGDSSILNVKLTVNQVFEGEKWNRNVGVVTTLFPVMDSTTENTAVIVCGPEIMIKRTVEKLLEVGFAESQIYVSLERKMNCGIGKCGLCQISTKFVCKDGPVFNYSEISELVEKVI